MHGGLRWWCGWFIMGFSLLFAQAPSGYFLIPPSHPHAPHVPRSLLQDTLGMVGDEPIRVGEFLRMYERSSFEDSLRYDSLSLRSYWNIYTRFRQKIQDARNMHMDTVARIRSEIQQYRLRLFQHLIYTQLALDTAVREAFQRRQWEVRLRHILRSPSDTPLPPASFLLSLRRQIEKGELSFEEASRQFSADPRSAVRGGDLGWFTAFTLPYRIEEEVYRSLTPGRIIGPIRTRAGYHLIRIDSVRRSPGELKTAHIFFRVQDWQDSTQVIRAQQKAEKVLTELARGASFEELAEEFSEDLSTARRGGEFRWFSAGEVLPEYYEAARSLKPGEWTRKPIRTRKGFYIIRLQEIREVPPTLETFRHRYEEEIRRDRERMNSAVQKVLNALAKRIGIRTWDKTLQWFIRKYRTDLEALPEGRELICQKGKKKKLVRTPDGKTFRLKDFCEFLRKSRYTPGRHESTEEWVHTRFRQYVNEHVRQWVLKHFEEIFPEMAPLIREYEEGLLFFEWMNQRIWQPAMEDTAALRKFYESHPERFPWKEVIDAYLLYIPRHRQDLQKMVETTLSLTRSLPLDSVLKQIREQSQNLVIIQTGPFLPGEDHPVLRDTIGQTPGIFGPYPHGNYLVYVYSRGVRPATFEDLRPRIITEYQSELEVHWGKELDQKYPVRLNEAVFRKLVAPPH